MSICFDSFPFHHGFSKSSYQQEQTCRSGELGCHAKVIGIDNLIDRDDIGCEIDEEALILILLGFTSDLLIQLVRKTLLNPFLTLPVLLLSYYTPQGQSITANHDIALSRLKYLFYFGLVRWLNGILSRQVLNNWQPAKYDWNREIAVVTGGSDGIGKHIALLLAEQGVEIAILDIQPLTFTPRMFSQRSLLPNPDDLVAPNIHYYHCDVTIQSAVSNTASEIVSKLGKPTILINNAGIATPRPMLSSSEASVARTFDINIVAHFRLVKIFLPDMIAANHGTIVTIASLAAAVSTPCIVDYCCSKASALAFHEGLATELKTLYNAPAVRTVCVAPGWTETAMTVGVKNESRYLLPTMHVETVAERAVEKILEGSSGVLVLPDTAWWLGWVARAWPMWMQVTLRNSGLKFVEEWGKGK